MEGTGDKLLNFMKQGIANVAKRSSSQTSSTGLGSSRDNTQQQQLQQAPPLTLTSPRTPSPNGTILPVKINSQAPIDNRPWTASDIGTNSIASVLNDPTSGPASLLSQTSASLLSITSNSNAALSSITQKVQKSSVAIRSVKAKEFEGYLKDITDQGIYDKYTDSISPNAVDESMIISFGEVGVDKKDGRQAASNFVPATTALSTSSQSKQNSLENIPRVFFEQDFSLEDPRVFEQVTEFANVTTAAPSISSNKASNALLQEKLSHYLDVVEVHLVQEISLRSNEFFAALSNIQSLHQETLECLKNIKEIRQALRHVMDDQAKKGLELVRKKKRRTNLVALYECVKSIGSLKKTQPTIQILLNQGDVNGALALISEANASLKGQIQLSSSFVDLSQTKTLQFAHINNLQSVKVLAHLSGQLSEMTKLIEKLMEDNFSKLLKDYIDSSLVKSLVETEADHMWAKKLLFSEMDENTMMNSLVTATDIEKEEMISVSIAPLVLGLIKTEKISTALQNFKDKLTKTYVKKVTKQYFPPAAPSDQEGGGNDGALAKYFRTLPLDVFMDILKNTFTMLLQLFKKVVILNEIIISHIKNVEQSGVIIGEDKVQNPASQPQTGLPIQSVTAYQVNYTAISNEVMNILFETTDTAHVRCGKILTLREEQNKQLNFKDFFRLFELITRFVQVSEGLCKQRSSIGLRGTIMTQAKGFVNYFHMERTRQLSQMAEHEQWNATDVPKDYQEMANALTGFDDIEVGDQNNLDDEENQTVAKKKISNVQSGIVYNKKSYKVATCCLLLIDNIDKYLLCARRIPPLTPDVINRLVELLKFYNTKTSEIIVGGLAVQMNILKAITPKHLAVSAQSLAYIAALVPHIKVQLEALLPQRQHVLLNDLDTVIEDYNANLGKIDERIISIMEDVIKTLCSKINEINWDQPPSSSDPSNYMVELVKNTKKLHSSVKKFFFAEKIKSLFAAIFSKYNQYLEAQYLNLKLYSSHGKNRLLFDVKYYISNLSSLEWVDSPGNMLEVVVNNIRIRDVKEKSLPSVPPANPGSSQQNQSHAAQSITSRTTAMFSGLTNAVKPKVMGSQ